jgi:hypothetical protein
MNNLSPYPREPEDVSTPQLQCGEEKGRGRSGSDANQVHLSLDEGDHGGLC